MRRKLNIRSGTNEKGSAIIEFALCFALFWTPLFLGTYQIGFNLVRAVQVTQICRDAGHMYSQRADFTSPSYQNLLNQLMPAAFHPTSSGNTILYFSTITYIDANACISGGLQADTVNCPNLGKAVFINQTPYGNTGLRRSDFGTPSPSILDSSYNIASKNYLKDPTAVANKFLNVISLSSSSQFAYLAEMYVNSSDLNVSNFLGTTGEYSRSVF